MTTASQPLGLSDVAIRFLTERHLAILTTLRADGSPHSSPVGFSYSEESQVARIITQATSVKARNAERGCLAAITQLDGARWITLEGRAHLITDHDGIEAAVLGYSQRYQPPRQTRASTRVAIEVHVTSAMGRY